MNASPFLITKRLVITPLTDEDAVFILELVNTQGWLKFIGNRNVTTVDEAVAYIQKILDNKNISYFVVRLKDHLESIGIVTFIKRDYLEYHDIGFAFLPGFSHKGYAFEATIAVLNKLIKQHNIEHILATTIPENTSSINLLRKLGLLFEKAMDVGDQRLHVYGAEINNLRLKS